MGSSKPKNEGNIQKSTKPVSFYSPLGNMTASSSGRAINYAPKGFGDIAGTLGQMGDQITGATSQLPQTFSLNDYYNNPFYENTRSLYTQPITRQYQQDSEELRNQLSARNQLNSSYDALMNRNLMQNRDYNLAQAEASARGASANAYTTNLQTIMDRVNNLTDVRGALMQQYFMPANVAQGVQSSITPLQVARANYYAQQDAPRQSGGGVLGGVLGALGSAGGAYTGTSCWVAREVYGASNPKWLKFRRWLLNKAPEKTRALYLTKGPEVADIIRHNPRKKAEFKQTMDRILEMEAA